MDLLSQGLLAATSPTSFNKKKQNRGKLFFCLFLVGLFPDIDVLFSNANNPLSELDLHRQFSHSFILAPIFSILLSFIFKITFLKKEKFTCMYLLVLLAYTSHILLDSLTSYGTSFLWPISTQKYSFNLISIIDPIYTSILLLCALFYFLKKTILQRIFFLLSISYLASSFIIKNNIKNSFNKLTQQRQHQVIKSVIKPSFGNIILWRSVYLHKDKIYADAYRFQLFKPNKIIQGDEKSRFHLKQLGQSFQNVKRNDYLIIDRYIKQHSNDFVSLTKAPDSSEYYFNDERFSLLPHKLNPVWALKWSPQKSRLKRFKMTYFRKFSQDQKDEFFKILRGNF